MYSARESLQKIVDTSVIFRELINKEFDDIGVSDVINIKNTFKYIIWQQTNDASSTAPSVSVEGSLDGSTWFTLDSSTAIGKEIRFIIDKPVPYLRVNVGSLGDGTKMGIVVYVSG